MKIMDESHKNRYRMANSIGSGPDDKQEIEAPRERLRLEKLISHLSAMSVNLPASEVDGQIKQGLKRINIYRIMLESKQHYPGRFADNLGRRSEWKMSVRQKSSS